MQKNPLPTLNSPSLVATLPISKQKVKYRPFVVGEQQALVLAQESEDEDAIFETISDVLTQCTGNTINIKSLSLADLSYLFLQLHIASVGQEIQVTTECENSDCKHEILINLNLNQVYTTEVNDNKVFLTQDVGIIFNYPTYEDTFALAKYHNDPIAGIYHLIVSIFDSDMVYDKSDYSLEEFKKWFLQMNDDQLGKIYKFVDDLPELVYDLKYTCPKCRHEHSKRLEGLHTFFRISSERVLA